MTYLNSWTTVTIVDMFTDIKESKLQEAFNEVSRISKRDQMKLNAKKRNELINFRRNISNEQIPEIVVENSTLHRVHEATLLYNYHGILQLK